VAYAAFVSYKADRHPRTQSQFRPFPISIAYLKRKYY